MKDVRFAVFDARGLTEEECTGFAWEIPAVKSGLQLVEVRPSTP